MGGLKDKEIKFYDKKNDRLIFCNEGASSSFWDRHWGERVMDLKGQMEGFLGNRWILDYVEKYLEDVGGWILEGGCGMGGYVYCLDSAGYNVIGIDYAKKMVDKIKLSYSDLRIECQDVRGTLFEDNYFSIYFSFGVIEHFYEGYDSILKEAFRILKDGGYWVVSFPQISLLRRAKIYFKGYEEYSVCGLDDRGVRERFYQFALNSDRVMRDIEGFGFELVDRSKYDGIKGFKDEVSILKSFLQSIYDGKRGLRYRYLLDIILKPIASHMAILVFKKKVK